MRIALVILLVSVGAFAQAPGQPAPVRAIFVSDIHFEPFWDPGKVARLAAAPESKWRAILAAPDSANRRHDFASLQDSCHARGEDASYPLLASSIAAMRAHAAGAAFVVMSGDLLAHSFTCKYRTLFPHAQPYQYRSFVEKTIRFVMTQLESAAPRVPVYATLGNNDSDCGDYNGDAHSAFLEGIAPVLMRTLPRRERSAALTSFSANGSYSVTLPAPMQSTRLIVVDDVFLSAKHTTCSGRADRADQQELLAWLTRQLDQARAAKQRVWVMGHIPPGIDAYATLAHISGACGRRPTTLLSSRQLADTLADGSDVIKLAIFGHTHEDEIELIHGDAASRHGTTGEDRRDIPVKIVPSISPVNGNEPSFTMAQVDPATSALVDYQVIAGGEGKPWAQTYDFDKAYGVDSFSAASVSALVEKFSDDPNAKSHDSRVYIHDFMTGSNLPLLSLVWPQYVCTMEHQSAEGFTACACKAK